MPKTQAEVNEERATAIREQVENEFKESQQAAIDARQDTPTTEETEEEYHARVAAVPGIFGDTDTGVAGPSDVPSAKNETASVAAAQVEADAQAGDEAAQDTTHNEARRQVDAQAQGTTAEEVDAGAEEQHESSDEESHESPLVESHEEEEHTSVV